MIQQFLYREFTSAHKRVDRFLLRNKYLRVVNKESDITNSSIVYSLGYKWSIWNIVMLNKMIRLSLTKVDGSVTRLDLSMVKRGKQLKGAGSTRTTVRLLDNLMYII